MAIEYFFILISVLVIVLQFRFIGKKTGIVLDEPDMVFNDLSEICRNRIFVKIAGAGSVLNRFVISRYRLGHEN